MATKWTFADSYDYSIGHRAGWNDRLSGRKGFIVGDTAYGKGYMDGFIACDMANFVITHRAAMPVSSAKR